MLRHEDQLVTMESFSKVCMSPAATAGCLTMWLQPLCRDACTLRFCVYGFLLPALLFPGKEHTVNQTLTKTVTAESKKGEITDFEGMTIPVEAESTTKVEENEEAEDLKRLMSDLRFVCVHAHDCMTGNIHHT